ncbi:MAG: Gfo/Idh/MocA family oxidoreductase [Defluviitaleaceae bacterium]|nr:Gfo/Idh/MocA family oxidoreductase [Defluviitaleaceae bacterium]
MKVGIIGCGNISGIYLDNISCMFNEISLAGVYDTVGSRAAEVAQKYSTRQYNSLDEMLACPDVDIVLNLTLPKSHFEINMKAIAAGKHVYTEKPLGVSYAEGKQQLAAARAKGMRIGGAPDTFMGAGIKTCSKLIQDGHIGQPVGATAFMTSRGWESWHPDPAFYYQPGGGPVLDMGPYYLTALVSLLGPVGSVAAMGQASFETRTITSQPKFGQQIKVEVPTYVTSLLGFSSGAIGNFMATFDVHAANLPIIEIYGSEGTLAVPDPNYFKGPVKLFRPDKGEFTEIPLIPGHSENSRGLGIANMAAAIKAGRPHEASGELLLHVLEIMESIGSAAKEGRAVKLETTVETEPTYYNL